MIILILLLNTLLLILGNYVYAKELPLLFQIATSELCFIILYTMMDKGNIYYGWKFTILSILVNIQFLLPIDFYKTLFFSEDVRLFSIAIATIATIINSLLIKNLLHKGFTKLLSSRISTTIASAVEISCFAFLLEIGLKGALLTAFVRIIYIIIIPNIIFRTKFNN